MYRLLLHVPVGAACAVLTRVSNTLASILALLFVVYETNQDRHKNDRAYLDIAGAAWGVAIGGAVLLIMRKRGPGPAPRGVATPVATTRRGEVSSPDRRGGS